jgi:hypothetical protein
MQSFASAQPRRRASPQSACRSRPRTLLRRVEDEGVPLAAELTVQHVLSGGAEKAVRAGGSCPEHGGRCSPRLGPPQGLLGKRPWWGEMEMSAWVVRHQAWHGLHSNIHEGALRKTTSLELLVLTAAAGLARCTVYDMPIAMARPRLKTEVEADHPDPGACFEGDARLAGMSSAAFIEDIADAVENILNGIGGRGSRSCERG